jgi:hypothetical protein
LLLLLLIKRNMSSYAVKWTSKVLTHEGDIV